MAEAIIDRWHLAVLRVGLDLTSRTPMVTSELEGYPDGVRRQFWRRTDPLEAFGLEHTVAAPTRLTCPDELRDAVRETLRVELSDEAALWLRLVPPYGYLGAVPWEEALVADTGLPVLRVPDRLPVPSDTGSTWTMAIAISALSGTTWAPDHVLGLLSKLPDDVEPPVEVDLFCDAGTRAALLQRMPAFDPTQMNVRLHDPAAATRASQKREARAAPPYPDPRDRSAPTRADTIRAVTPGLRWGDWIVEGLAGRAVRALHLAAEAVFDGDRPLLAISPDPEAAREIGGSTYVGADELRQLADQLGAPAVTFASPPGRSSDCAVRVLADVVGQQRPGPTWYSSLMVDPDSTWLSKAFAFHANSPEAARLPRHASLFAYLQPEYVRPYLIEEWPDLESRGDLPLLGATEGDEPPADATPAPMEPPSMPPSGAGGLDGPMPPPVASVPPPTMPPPPAPAPPADSPPEVAEQFQHTAVVPAWVAASERFVDTGMAELLDSGATLAMSVPEKQSYQEGAKRALHEVRQMVARHAGKS